MIKFIKKILTPKNRELADNVEEKMEMYIKFHLKNGSKAFYLSGFEMYDIWSDLMKPNHTPVIDCGNWEQAGMEEMFMLTSKIRKHPFLWRLFQL